MPVIDIFTECVKYKYKTNLSSYGTLVIFFGITITLSIPIIIIHLTGGFWLRNEIYTEMPDVIFKHKYLMIAESKEDLRNPIICSTFRYYKENKISDSCTITKIQELDTNKDGYNDVLKFELHFYTNLPIRFMRLLLFFNYELKDKSKLIMETMTAMHYTIPLDVQKIFIVGDLRLNQKNLLRNYGTNDIYNHSIDIDDYSLFQLITENASKKFTTKIENDIITWETGFSNEEKTVIKIELHYSEELIYYQPDMWEELKWAWIQYFSFFFVFLYVVKYIIKFIFLNRYVHSYVISPWNEKYNK